MRGGSTLSPSLLGKMWNCNRGHSGECGIRRPSPAVTDPGGFAFSQPPRRKAAGILPGWYSTLRKRETLRTTFRDSLEQEKEGEEKKAPCSSCSRQAAAVLPTLTSAATSQPSPSPFCFCLLWLLHALACGWDRDPADRAQTCHLQHCHRLPRPHQQGLPAQPAQSLARTSHGA